MYGQQFYAMLVKRMLHSWRNRVVTLTQVLVPVFFAIMACLVVRTLPVPSDVAPTLPLDLSRFSDQVKVLNHFKLSVHMNKLFSGCCSILNIKSLCGSFLIKVIPYVTTSTDLNSHDNQIANTYKTFVESQGHSSIAINKVEGYRSETDLQQYIMDIGSESMDTYNNRYLVAASFNYTDETRRLKATAEFNNQAYHTPGVALNMLTNALLRYLTKDGRFILISV